jgi:hypothetical protein
MKLVNTYVIKSIYINAFKITGVKHVTGHY